MSDFKSKYEQLYKQKCRELEELRFKYSDLLAENETQRVGLAELRAPLSKKVN